MLSVSLGTHTQFQNAIERNSARTNKALERLATGQRINSPKDDPAGFIAAEDLKEQLSDLQSKLSGISTQRTESHLSQSALANIQKALVDIRDHVLEGSNSFLTADQQQALRAQVNDAIDAVGQIAKPAGLPDPIQSAATVQTGPASPDPAQVLNQLANEAPPPTDSGNAGSPQAPTADARTNVSSLVRGANQSSPVSGESGAQTILDGGQNALDLVHSTSQRVVDQEAALGADESTNLDTFQRLYQDESAITTEALSQVRDADFATETAALTQSQVLLQAAMLALSYSDQVQVGAIKHLLDQTA
jgi:flagellin